jgi:hypothetical protein
MSPSSGSELGVIERIIDPGEPQLLLPSIFRHVGKPAATAREILDHWLEPIPHFTSLFR